jgi:glycosyltransferase involved in cell wall biosynthesis
LRIVHLTTSGQLGGAETSLLALISGLRQAECQWGISVIAPGPGALVEELTARGIAVRVLPFPHALARLGESGDDAHGFGRRAAAIAASVPYASQLARALRQERPGIIHAHGFKMHVLSAIARPPRAAVIWHVHGYIGQRPLTTGALRRLVSRTAAVVANSHSVAADVARAIGTRVPIHTLYNALDLAQFAPAGAQVDLDALAGFPPAPDATVRVGLVSTLGRWKGHATFLDAIQQVPASTPLRGYVIGGAIYETEGSQISVEQLRHDAEARGLGQRVGFTGFVRNAAEAMRALDIVVHASTEPEPFGMVIAEAMACGRAVIASRAGGAAELIDDGVDALAHDPGDATQLAQAIMRLAGDPVLRTSLGARARAKAVEAFDCRRLAASLAPVYRTVARA